MNSLYFLLVFFVNSQDKIVFFCETDFPYLNCGVDLNTFISVVMTETVEQRITYSNLCANDLPLSRKSLYCTMINRSCNVTVVELDVEIIVFVIKYCVKPSPVVLLKMNIKARCRYKSVCCLQAYLGRKRSIYILFIRSF